MKERGKFVDFEGIDGSGKGTQTRDVAERLKGMGFTVETISFPRYDEFWGKKCGRYLTGEDGNVSPYFAFLIFAEDRREAAPQIDDWLSLGFLVIADRYELSNRAHQGARVDPEKRKEFMEEVAHVEYERFGIPRPNLFIVFNTLPQLAQKKVVEKGKRSYIGEEQDILEKDLEHLSETAKIYQQLVEENDDCVLIDVVDENGEMLLKEEITEKVLAVLRAHEII